MRTIASIRGYDEDNGPTIYIGIEGCYDDDGRIGWRVVASNGDDVATSAHPLQYLDAIRDIERGWGGWKSFQSL
jgi:hypothetical protein